MTYYFYNLQFLKFAMRSIPRKWLSSFPILLCDKTGLLFAGNGAEFVKITCRFFFIDFSPEAWKSPNAVPPAERKRAVTGAPIHQPQRSLLTERTRKCSHTPLRLAPPYQERERGCAVGTVPCQQMALNVGSQEALCVRRRCMRCGQGSQ